MNATYTSNALRQQNYVNALRIEMGLPLHALANDGIGYMFGPPVDVPASAELARIAQEIGKDLVHVSFQNAIVRKPIGFTVVWRELDHVEVMTNCMPYVSEGNGVSLVCLRSDGQFAVDSRGSMIRLSVKPVDLRTGRKLAMRLIKKTADSLACEHLADTQTIQSGAVPTLPQRRAPLVLFS